MNSSPHNYAQIKDKSISIIGLAKSGVAAAKLAHFRGANVFVSDGSESRKMRKSLNELSSVGIQGETGGHSKKIFDSDLWVLSPGVPKDCEIIQKSKKYFIPIVSEIEFASWFTEAPIIAVTGSNGKTTTVNMLQEMCRITDYHSLLSGNMGYPFSDAVRADLENPDEKRVHILEISSFQMEFIQYFQPFISVFLNLSPDHLNRYDDYDDYISAKMNMWKNQTKDDFLVFNGDDNLLSEKIMPANAKKFSFSLQSDSNVIFRLNQTKIYDKDDSPLIELCNVSLPGKHNLSNFLAAATAAHLLGIKSSSIKKIMSTFCGVSHRLEPVGEVEGVKYINDSKATNVEAVKVALDSFDEPVLLILGGRDKGGDFLSLKTHTYKKVKEVITIGESGDAIAATFRDAVRLHLAGNLHSAVDIAHSHAQPGDIVLLSPGCASFDQFSNFEERGNTFKKLVQNIKVHP